jgi:hypothetical protein
MRNKTRLDILESDISILSRKVEMLAQIVKDYVDHEQSLRMDSGKWYPEAIDTNV